MSVRAIFQLPRISRSGEINFPWWMGGWVVGIGNKSQLSPAIAEAGAWPELGKMGDNFARSTLVSSDMVRGHRKCLFAIFEGLLLMGTLL